MQYKITIAGPVGAGKTTAVSTLSDKRTVSSEEKASDATALIKSHTTVAMDYGIISLDDHDSTLHVYGTPGQTRFSFMWDMLQENSIGTLLLIDHEDLIERERFTEYLNVFGDGATPLIIGLTKSHSAFNRNERHIRALLSAMNKSFPILSIDPRSRRDLVTAVELITCQHLYGNQAS